MSESGRTIGTAVALLAAALLGSVSASASPGGYCTELQLHCENGRTYPVCPIAVSDMGELVTGRLVLSPRHGVHVRLVPMGQGYRYIGRGIYFEGVRSDAMIYFGNKDPLACTVTHG
jgi:hypothetical protein